MADAISGSKSTQDTSKVKDIKKDTEASKVEDKVEDATSKNSSKSSDVSTKPTPAVAETKGGSNKPTSDEPTSEDTSGSGPVKADETPNSDGFIPGTPLSKNHPDSSLKAKQEKKDAEEHDPNHKTATATTKKAEHHGLLDKIKGVTHHETKEPKAEA